MPDSAAKTIMSNRSRTVVEPASLGYSRLYLDFLADREPAASFFRARSLAEVADHLEQTNHDRNRIHDILRRQNSLYSASAATMANIDRLKEDRALCLFAGQQAGLFGGPLLTQVKALAVVKCAAMYSEQLSRPVIPIFWIAGDDHDFEEANHTFVLARNGEPCRIAYDSAPKHPLPIAEVTFEDHKELARAITQLKDCLGTTDFTEDLLALIERAYTGSDSMVTAFGKLMAGLTDGLGLVLFSPGDTEVKQLSLPFFRTVIEKQDEIHERLHAANSRLEKAGYHIQVEKRDDASHLFYNLRGRRPILRQGDGFIVDDKHYTTEGLLEELTAHPERFSPDVMLRPVFQSYLLPTVSQKGGPAEIAYLAQLNDLFDLFDLPAPLHRARATVTVVEKRMGKYLADYEFTFAELTGDVEQIINRVLAKTFPDDLERDFEKLRENIEGEFDNFRDEALQFDPGLKEFARQSFGKIDFTLKAFEAKVFSAHKKKSQQTRDRIYRVAHALYPRHGLQERTLNISYFLARYGFGFVKFLYEQMDSEETSHQLISMTEYTE